VSECVCVCVCVGRYVTPLPAYYKKGCLSWDGTAVFKE
jgi:hypothetical protein